MPRGRKPGSKNKMRDEIWMCPRGHDNFVKNGEPQPGDTLWCTECDDIYPRSAYTISKAPEPKSTTAVSWTFEERPIVLHDVAELVKQMLIALGQNPDREGLVDTPMRVARFWDEFLNYKDENHSTTFEAIQADQMIVVAGMPAWSVCEHHLLPFSATVSVGYIPASQEDEGKILGLSKIARVVHICAHKLQTQEGLVDDISKMLKELLGKPLGIAVVASGVHTCMTMRGIRTPGVMTTSKMSGVFKRQHEVREEFFSLIKHGNDFGRW